MRAVRVVFVCQVVLLFVVGWLQDAWRPIGPTSVVFSSQTDRGLLSLHNPHISFSLMATSTPASAAGQFNDQFDEEEEEKEQAKLAINNEHDDDHNNIADDSISSSSSSPSPSSSSAALPSAALPSPPLSPSPPSPAEPNDDKDYAQQKKVRKIVILTGVGGVDDLCGLLAFNILVREQWWSQLESAYRSLGQGEVEINAFLVNAEGTAARQTFVHYDLRRLFSGTALWPSSSLLSRQEEQRREKEERLDQLASSRRALRQLRAGRGLQKNGRLQALQRELDTTLSELQQNKELSLLLPVRDALAEADLVIDIRGSPTNQSTPFVASLKGDASLRLAQRLPFPVAVAGGAPTPAADTPLDWLHFHRGPQAIGLLAVCGKDQSYAAVTQAKLALQAAIGHFLDLPALWPHLTQPVIRNPKIDPHRQLLWYRPEASPAPLLVAAHSKEIKDMFPLIHQDLLHFQNSHLS